MSFAPQAYPQRKRAAGPSLSRKRERVRRLTEALPRLAEVGEGTFFE